MVNQPLSAGKSTDRSPQVQSLTRALMILEILADHDGGLSLTEMAGLATLPTSTTHRLLTTLENRRFVRFNRSTSLWSVGVRSFVVGNAFARSRNFVPLARIFMRHLMEQSGETVNLATRDNEEVVYLAQVECREMMRAFVRPGARSPMYCSAVGKALLAAQPETEFRVAMKRRSFVANDPEAVLATPEFDKILDDVRRRGYALDDEEQAVGMRCVAAVIYDENGGPLAAISVSGPSARITDERIPILGALVNKTCGDITADFGGRRPEEI